MAHPQRFTPPRASALILFAASLLASRVLAAPVIRTVALSGQPAQGTPAGVTFAALTTAARLNNAGQAAFEPSLAGTGITVQNDTGMWSEGSGALSLVAREGASAPGAVEGVVFAGAPFRTVLNNSGRAVILALLTGTDVTSANNRGVWSTAAGPLSLIIRSGDAAPGTPAGMKLSTISPTVLANDAGQIVFSSTLAGPGTNSANDEGIWIHSASVTSLVARKGTQAPGLPGGASFLSLGSPALNGTGQIAFSADLTGAVTASDDSGIWRGTSGALQLRVRAGDPAPGAPGFTFFGFSNLVALSRSGNLAFLAGLTGSGITGSNDTGIWSETAGALNLIAREGNPAAGAVAGETFALFTDPLINGQGTTVFRASLTGTGVTPANDVGLWTGNASGLALVAREGSAAAETPAGVTFGAIDAPILNAVGQIAISGSLAGASVTTANDRALWATDAEGELRLIAREGDQLEVSPGVRRTISAFAPLISTGDDDGQPSVFNDHGQLAFTASFTDGSSGAFVSSLVASLPGDFNLDGEVNAADLTLWQTTFGDAHENLHADDDFDGDVDGADFLIWQRHVGQSTAAAVRAGLPIPEPASWLLAMLAVAALSRIQGGFPRGPTGQSRG